MANPENPATKTCPNCGATVPREAKQCPQCGQPLPANGSNWFKNLTATEIFLLVLGGIMLAIGLVAL
ncbi:zinc-ribbon domain-containing protein [Pontibacter anaerobius]|uniref:Zinc-ribbon domain-containing protein n=1 Tax=Pontibacter anaerobius TaxID=2993940 RepID=A0ABT3RGD5_9BACT|nr:zinc-ribbon domain-containing protein [Pontibacter anaerobius]MCX2740538.1 zinc-ribbon domain-containing protein [Pontibacter anaerobius]